MKDIIVSIVLGIVVIFGLWMFVHWAFEQTEKAAIVDCAQYNAKPKFTYRTDYICVTPDGRIVT